MKRLMLLIVLLTSAVLFGGYQVGDVVEDFEFQESNGGAPVTSSIHELIDQGKVVFLNFGDTT